MRWRTSLTAALLVLLLLSASRAGDEDTKAIATKRVALESELRDLLKDYGPTHPTVVALKERIAQITEDAPHDQEFNPKGLLVVLAKDKEGTTLKDARIRFAGGHAFIVGVEVDTLQITRPTFVGKTVWIPVDNVVRMVEWDEPKGK